MTTLFKKWWFWLGLVVVAIFLWQYLTAWSMSSKLYNMALDDLRVDQTKIVRTLEQTVTEREKELADVYSQLEIIKKRQIVVQIEVERLRGKINELQRQRESYVAPSDPDGLVNELHKLGIGSAHRRKDTRGR